jgi:hypothetical protein
MLNQLATDYTEDSGHNTYNFLRKIFAEMQLFDPRIVIVLEDDLIHR